MDTDGGKLTAENGELTLLTRLKATLSRLGRDTGSGDRGSSPPPPAKDLPLCAQ